MKRYKLIEGIFQSQDDAVRGSWILFADTEELRKWCAKHLEAGGGKVGPFELILHNVEPIPEAEPPEDTPHLHLVAEGEES